MTMLRRAMAVALVVCSSAAMAQQATLPAGKLRATYIGRNSVQAFVAPRTNEVRGPAAALTQELARRLGVSFNIAGVDGVRGVIDSIKNGDADIGFIAYDAVRAEEVDFSHPYALAQNTYMVLETSPVRGVADIDKPGMRVGVGEHDAGDYFLTRTLKNAVLVRNPGGQIDVGMTQLMAGEIDAYAANRQRLTEFAKHVAGIRLLPDNFYGVEQSIVVAKGNKTLLDAVNKLIEDARNSGLIRTAIEQAGIAGLDVAPAELGRR